MDLTVNLEQLINMNEAKSGDELNFANSPKVQGSIWGETKKENL